MRIWPRLQRRSQAGQQSQSAPRPKQQVNILPLDCVFHYLRAAMMLPAIFASRFHAFEVAKTALLLCVFPLLSCG